MWFNTRLHIDWTRRLPEHAGSWMRPLEPPANTFGPPAHGTGTGTTTSDSTSNWRTMSNTASGASSGRRALRTIFHRTGTSLTSRSDTDHHHDHQSRTAIFRECWRPSGNIRHRWHSTGFEPSTANRRTPSHLPTTSTLLLHTFV